MAWPLAHPERSFRFALVAAACALAACATPGEPGSAVAPEHATPPPPSELYPDLFPAVALADVVPAKDWVDAVPLESPAAIRAAYAAEAPRTPDALKAFVVAHFRLPTDETAPAGSPAEGLPLRAHIAALWPVLTRDAPEPEPGSSLLALPHGYIVPGGRFREVYYWDSYFTMLGLADHPALKRDMVANFAHEIDAYGHVPNGNRSYYLSRSQPPFFFMMVSLLAADEQQAYLGALEREYAFWMEGADGLAPGRARARVERLADGALLNRYWDARAAPRDESYAQDVATAAAAEGDRAAPVVYRELRAAAESGWDFSSRWLADEHDLSSIETTHITPPDLNALLYGLARAIAESCAAVRDAACEADYEAAAADRAQAMRAHLWDDALGAFVDYDFVEDAQHDQITAAALYPLFFGLATPEEARRTADVAARELLALGGLLTTTEPTGQQWDAPNGWAPLHWIAVQGFAAYGEDDLSHTIAARWLATVARTYCETGKLVEKYDVAVARPGGGGEYPLQDGFGWTNGVTAALLDAYPDLAAYGEVTPAPAELTGRARASACAEAAE